MTVTVDGEVYTTVNDAVFAANNGQTIVMDGAMTEDVVIVGNKRIILDLNGHKLANKAGPTISIRKGASLTVVDNGERATGTIDSTVNGMPAIKVEPVGAVILKKCKVTRSAEDSSSNTANILSNFGVTLIDKDVTISGSSTKNANIRNGFDSKNPEEMAMYAVEGAGYTATMTILGGTFDAQSNCVMNGEYGLLNISGGTFTSATNCISNWTACNIAGGTLTSSAASPVITGSINKSAGAVRIAGGQFNAYSGQPIIAFEEPGAGSTKTPVVTGGTFSTVESPLPNYIPSGYVISGSSVVVGSWTLEDDGLGGVGFFGHRKLIAHRDTIPYVTGGLPEPQEIGDAVLISATAKGGVTGYYDKGTKKVLLYRAGSELPEEAVEDLTLVFLEL